MIVIFAREDDRHAAAVADVLTREHHEAVTIFNLSLFPADIRLSCSTRPTPTAARSSTVTTSGSTFTR